LSTATDARPVRPRRRRQSGAGTGQIAARGRPTIGSSGRCAGARSPRAVARR
jgi:hypothetical protein